MSDLVRYSAEVLDALSDKRPVVALETTIAAHGFPAGEGTEVARECEARVRDHGAVPATVAVLDGYVRVGLENAELERLTDPAVPARKVGPRDLSACVADGAVGATTVGGTLAACALAGIGVMATGGIGGVHRGYARRPDVSADLVELTRAPVVVVCSGIKSLLDVHATMELLETLGVPVIGYGTDTLPLFYSADGGPPVPARADSAEEVARVADIQRRLGGGAGLVVARPPDPSLDDVAPLIEDALAEANAAGIEGQAITPFVLGMLHERSEGRTLAVNRALAADNAALAAEIAEVYARYG